MDGLSINNAEAKSPGQRKGKPDKAPALDQLLPAAESRVFLLTRMAMIRALEIHYGSPPLVEYHSSEKETTIALREIAQGKVVLNQNKKPNKSQDDKKETLE